MLIKYSTLLIYQKLKIDFYGIRSISIRKGSCDPDDLGTVQCKYMLIFEIIYKYKFLTCKYDWRRTGRNLKPLAGCMNCLF